MTGAHAAGIGLSILSGALFAAYGLAVRRYMSEMGSVVAFAAISQNTAAAMVVLMLFLGRGSGVGAINELVEFLAVLTVPETGVGGYENTALDLCSNLIGGFAAVAWLRWMPSRPCRLSAGQVAG